MKKITLLLLSACNLFLFAQTNRTTDVIPSKVTKAPIVYKLPTAPVVSLNDYYKEFNAQNLIAPKLYMQMPTATDNVSSQKFDAANSMYDSNAADDFKVPTDKLWTINAVFVDGSTSSSAYPTSFNVTFYKNSASNLPDAVVRTENVVLAAGAASPTLALATPLILAEGTYWISVQAVMDLTGGQWFWSTYNDPGTINEPFAWTNPGNGFGTPCNVGWKTASTCLPSQLKDLQFSLDGVESNAICKTFTGRIMSTDPTHSPRITRDGVASTCSTPKTYPGNFGSGNFHYKSYTVQNTSGSAECVTFTIKNTDPTPANQVHLMAYMGSFNPANLSQNYLGDTGSSSGEGIVQTMSVIIPGNTTVVLVASEPAANTTFAADYTINVISPNCGSVLRTIEKSNDAINVYPNPTTGVLFVNGMKPTQANVFDVSGKLISTKVEGNTIDTQKLPKGNYILKMEDKDGKSATTKFIKK